MRLPTLPRPVSRRVPGACSRALSLILLLALVMGICGGCGSRDGAAVQPAAGQADPLIAALSRHRNRLPAALESIDVSFQLNDDDRLVSVYLTLPKIGDAAVQRLAEAAQLRNLSLAGTAVTDDCCRVLGQLRQLESLDFSGTRITAAGLRELQSLSRLKIVNLSDTSISDEALEVVPAWRNLAELNLSGTRVSDAGLPNLRGLPALAFLNVKRTAVSAEGINRLERQLGALQQVQMDQPAADSGQLGRIPSSRDGDNSIRRSPLATADAGQGRTVRPPKPIFSAGQWATRSRDQLVDRMLTSNASRAIGLVSDYNLADRAANPLDRGPLAEALEKYCQHRPLSQIGMQADRLQRAWLCFGPRSGENIDKAGLERLASVPALHLDLSEAVLKASHFEGLSRLRNLHSLRLARTNADDVTLKWLSEETTLRELDLTATAISDDLLESLEQLPNLRSLWLGETAISDDGLRSLGRLAALQELDVSSTLISDAGLAGLQTLTNLQAIDFHQTAVTDAGVSSFRQHHPDCLIGYDGDRRRNQIAAREADSSMTDAAR